MWLASPRSEAYSRDTEQAQPVPSQGVDFAMWARPLNDQYADEIFVAGELVEPGIYRQLQSDRRVVLNTAERLPASLDGRVATYVRVPSAWQDQTAA